MKELYTARNRKASWIPYEAKKVIEIKKRRKAKIEIQIYGQQNETFSLNSGQFFRIPLISSRVGIHFEGKL